MLEAKEQDLNLICVIDGKSKHHVMPLLQFKCLLPSAGKDSISSKTNGNNIPMEMTMLKELMSLLNTIGHLNILSLFNLAGEAKGVETKSPAQKKKVHPPKEISSDPHNTTTFHRYSNKNGDKSEYWKNATETRKISRSSYTVIY
ncbi:hypothetical protein C5167_008844 [Papaver somniferum]|uniref:Uncharacterized protein n=1 Tax=Papaver somniferum TaxID=3469 RepID=A0A4Y7JVQ1_PAPSO|nr:hypothetical protein C5167_008844 [Papaver somniferum]